MSIPTLLLLSVKLKSGGVSQWVARGGRGYEPHQRPRCLLEQETLALLLNTGCIEGLKCQISPLLNNVKPQTKPTTRAMEQAFISSCCSTNPFTIIFSFTRPLYIHLIVEMLRSLHAWRQNFWLNSVSSRVVSKSSSAVMCNLSNQ